MKVEFLENGTWLRLEAQGGTDLEALFRLSESGSVRSRGPLGDAQQERVLESSLPFKRDFEDQGLAWATARGVEVLWALRVRLDWLSYGEPANAETRLRANTAARLGHGFLDALELVCRHSK